MISRFLTKVMNKGRLPQRRSLESVDMSIHLNSNMTATAIGEDLFKRKYYEDMISNPSFYFLCCLRPFCISNLTLLTILIMSELK